MAAVTTAKFRVWSIKPVELEGKVDHVEVILGAVTDTSGDNETFWRATPAGHLTMTITNPASFGVFSPGQEFYLDFTPAS